MSESPEKGETLPAATDATGGELTLEGRLQRLDEIVAALEGGEVELERGLALFEEGIRHIRESERLISQAELRVEELVREEGEPGTRPLEEEGA